MTDLHRDAALAQRDAEYTALTAEREVLLESVSLSAYRVKCPACGVARGLPCRGFEAERMVARDAQLEGRKAEAALIANGAFHDARLAKVGLGSAATETLPLFGGVL